MSDPASSEGPTSNSSGAFPVLRRRIVGRSFTARRAVLVISVATLTLTIIAGVLIWRVDHDAFPDLGDALWWALQTLTTVGYGDVVPGNTAGRVIGAVVMLNGLGFLTVLIAAVTALLVEQGRRRDEPDETAPLAAALDEIGTRLDAIEDRLSQR